LTAGRRVAIESNVHEYSLVSALIDRVAQEAAARGAKRVVRVHVKLGELSGVERELFATAYATFRERTVCEGAPMELEPVAAAWSCRACGNTVSGALRCKRCDVPATLVAGDEIVLSRIEMEVPDV